MLYHISIEPVYKFKLRIPQDILDGENDNIKRICFSKTIEGAISAMPSNISVIRGLEILEKAKAISSIMHIYEIDEKKLKKNDYYDSKYLAENNLVPDAEFTSEVWILTENIKPKHHIIHISDITSYLEYIDVLDRNILLVKNIKYRFLRKNNIKVSKTKRFIQVLRKSYHKETNKYMSKSMFRVFVGTCARDKELAGAVNNFCAPHNKKAL